MMPAAHANVQKISDVLETEMILGLHREKKKVGSYAGHATLDKDGNQDIKCVTICVQNAFHRVGVAAYSQAPASMLEHGQRPKPFIGSSRQLKLNIHPRQLGRALRPCASETAVSMKLC